MGIEVLSAGVLCTIQDMGRFGFRQYGVPTSGAMDWYAVQAANRLVGNQPNAPAIEFCDPGLGLVSGCNLLAAVAGGGYRLEVDGRRFPAWMSVYVQAGKRFEVVKTDEGVWGYLAISGGFKIEPVMKSASTYLRGGFGGFSGRCLGEGDNLLTESRRAALGCEGGRYYPPASRPDYSQQAEIRYIAERQESQTDAETARLFDGCEYLISAEADRMGYRLKGETAVLSAKADQLSEAVVPGCIQIPPDGRPIVLMSDCQTVGGYHKVGCVISADMPVFSQLEPESGKVRFTPVDTAEARKALRLLQAQLEFGIED